MNERCCDPRFEKQLYAWELGFLSDTEREELELHLLDCEACFKRAEKFADAAELLRNSTAVRAAVASQTPADRQPSEQDTRRVWPGVLRLTLAAAAVLAVLILRPWQLEFKPTHLAVAAANRLAVDNFGVVNDPRDSAHLGTMVADLIVANLSETGYLQVVSSQRWNDAARLYRDEVGLEKAAQKSSLEIAERVSARWLITGSVDESTQPLRLRSQIIEVGTGVVIATQEVVGDAGESFLGSVDRLTRKISSDLSIPSTPTSEAAATFIQITTSSREAYRYYIEGLEYAARYYRQEAISAFETALSFDSTFAMAYYELSRLKDRRLIDKAMQFSSNASWLEQQYIMAAKAEIDGRTAELRDLLQQIISRFPDEKDAYFKLGMYYWRQEQLDSATAYFHRTIKIDPTYRDAYNLLMYTYDEAGRFDRAVWAIDKYIELAPGEANPYDSRGDLYAQNGRPVEAADSYLQALHIKPDYATSAIKLALIWMYNREYTRADSLLQVLEQSPVKSTRGLARYFDVLMFVYQGKLESALLEIDSAIARTQRELDSTARDSEPIEFYELKAHIYAEKGMYDRALSALDRAISANQQSFPNDSVTFRYLYVRYLAAQGEFAGAKDLHRRLVAHTQATGEAPCYQYWTAGDIELALGNPEEAVKQLEKGTSLTSVATDFVGNFLLARAYLESGQLGKSVTLYEELSETYSVGRLISPIECVKLHYFLGMAYEESHWYDQAVKEYQTFLDFWSAADPGLNVVEDARNRLKRLESGS